MEVDDQGGTQLLQCGRPTNARARAESLGKETFGRPDAKHSARRREFICRITRTQREMHSPTLDDVEDWRVEIARPNWFQPVCQHETRTGQPSAGKTKIARWTDRPTVRATDCPTDRPTSPHQKPEAGRPSVKWARRPETVVARASGLIQAQGARIWTGVRASGASDAAEPDLPAG